MLKPLFSFMLMAVASAGYAQTIVDSSATRSPVKTLNLKLYDALLKGEDVYDMALAGELNHYPSPGKILDYKKELDLSPQQVTKLTTINTELIRKKKEMGSFIIKNERVIDSLFRTKKANDGNIIFFTNRYGIYHGELRNAILQACVKVQSLLTPKQISKFERLLNGK
ncbi:hypothetical protein GCM10023149_38470 [Mucilaginibacter gynuensis]|uniref:DUF4142 domain-containing protein n=1 Tax=Mucilaginibacter gynuensis TaxID=1302236 RepID=A0ABP8GZT9_9SPHI